MRTTTPMTLAVMLVSAAFLHGCCCCRGCNKPLTPEEEAEREAARESAEVAQAEADALAAIYWESVQALHTLIDPTTPVEARSCPDDDIRTVGEDTVGRRDIWTVDFGALPGVTGGLRPWKWLESGAYETLNKLDESPDDFWADDWRADVGRPENRHLGVFVGRERANSFAEGGGHFVGAVVVVDLETRAAICQAPFDVRGEVGFATLEAFQEAFERAANTALEEISGELRVNLIEDDR